MTPPEKTPAGATAGVGAATASSPFLIKPAAPVPKKGDKNNITRFEVSTANRINSNKPNRLNHFSLSELKEWLESNALELDCALTDSKPLLNAQKQRSPCIVCGRVDGRREAANVATRSMVALDVDGKQGEVPPVREMLARLAGTAALLYETAQSTEAKPRYRLLLPLATPIEGEALTETFRATTQAAVDRLDIPRDAVDNASYSLPHAMFAPACCTDNRREMVVHLTDGDLWPVVSAAARIPTSEPHGPFESYDSHDDLMEDDRAKLERFLQTPRNRSLYEDHWPERAPTKDTGELDGSEVDWLLAKALRTVSNDGPQIARLMRASEARHRDKWDENRDYLGRTIQRALAAPAPHVFAPIEPAAPDWGWTAAPGKLKRISQLVEGLVADVPHVLMMAGKQKSYKSTVAVELAMALSEGRSFFGRKVARPTATYYVAWENIEGFGPRVSTTLMRWFEKQHGRRPTADELRAENDAFEAKRMVFFRGSFGKLTRESAAVLIEEFDRGIARGEQPPKMMVFDTLGRALPGDTNSAETAANGIDAAEMFTAKYGCVVVFIAHPSRSGESLVMGSGMFENSARGILVVESSRHGNRDTITVTTEKIDGSRNGGTLLLSATPATLPAGLDDDPTPFDTVYLEAAHAFAVAVHEEGGSKAKKVTDAQLLVDLIEHPDATLANRARRLGLDPRSLSERYDRMAIDNPTRTRKIGRGVWQPTAAGRAVAVPTGASTRP